MQIGTLVSVLGGTQTEIAKRCGLSQATINRYWKVDGVPKDMSIGTLKCIATSLDMSLDELVDLLEENETEKTVSNKSIEEVFIQQQMEEVSYLYKCLNQDGQTLLLNLAKELVGIPALKSQK